MKFSVIIPTHDRDILLQRALKSALRQTLPPHEILVVDDTCSKMTEACVEGISKDSSVKVIYIENKKPIGTSLASINLGAEIATGDVLAILDDDDYWHKDYLKKVQDVMIREKADVVVTAKMNVDENGNLTIGKMPPEKYVKEEWLLRNPGCACSNFVVKKECFITVEGCDVRLKTSSDRDLFIRLMKAGLRYTVLKERLVYHSNYGLRLTMDTKKMFKSNLRLYIKYFREINLKLHFKIIKKLIRLASQAYFLNQKTNDQFNHILQRELNKVQVCFTYSGLSF